MDSQSGRAISAFSRVPALTAAAVVLLAMLLGVAVPRAFAHLADYTGEDSYYCTLSGLGGGAYECWYDGDSTGSQGSSIVAHSYAFQSVANQQLSPRYLCTLIHRPSSGRIESECGWDFKRNCWDAWQHSSDPLDCHDQDNVTHYVYMQNTSSSSAVVGGHPLW